MYQAKNHGEFRETWELWDFMGNGLGIGMWSAFLYMVLLASGTPFCQMSIKLGIQKWEGNFWDLFWSPFTHHSFSSALLGKSSGTPANDFSHTKSFQLACLLTSTSKCRTKATHTLKFGIYFWDNRLPHIGNSKLFLGKYELHLNLKQASECLALREAHHWASRSLMAQ